MSDEPHIDPTADRPQISRFVGVYDADHTLKGELTYWVGARLGRAHCALCDITHGSVRERSDWKACRAGLPIPFDTFHRDDQPDQVRAALGGAVPAVVAETTDGVVPLLDGDALEACAASPEALMKAVEAAAEAQGLDWPSGALDAR